MTGQERDDEDDFTTLTHYAEESYAAGDVIEVDEAEKRATVNVEATWQEYEDSVEFRFTAGEAKIEVTVPYDENQAGLAQVLVASLPQAFETAVEAYFADIAAEEADDDVPSGD